MAGYATTFGVTQAPLVDDGGWLQGQTHSIVMKNVNTTSGRMHASTFIADDYEDSVCARADFNNNYHFVTGVIYRAPGYNPTANHEVELVVGVQMSTAAGGSCKLYEFLWNTLGGAQFVRWNGPLNDVTPLAPTGPGIPGGRPPVDGDVMGLLYDATNPAQVVITAFLWNATNGVWDLVYTFTDTSAQRIQSGNPGASFFVRPGDTVLASFGFKYWVANSGTPAWLNGVPIGAWKEIPDSAMSAAAAMPTPNGIVGPRSRLDAYCGLVRKEADFYSVRNGGHGDYWGNEVVRFNAASNTPGWSMIKAPSGGAQINPANNYSRYPDGQPSSTHSYAHHRYIKQRNWFISVGNTAVANQGGTFTDCVVYDITTNAFLPVGTMDDCAAMAVADNAIFDDEATGDVYHCHGYALNRWNQATNAWDFNIAVFDGAVPKYYGIAGVACTDTLRRRALMLAGDAAARIPTVWDMTTHTRLNPTMTGDQTLVNSGGHYGMTFCPVLDRFYAMVGVAASAGLYQIHPTNWAISTKASTGGSNMPADFGGTGVWTRFQYVPTLGGLMYFPHHGSNAWFLRLH